MERLSPLRTEVASLRVKTNVSPEQLLWYFAAVCLVDAPCTKPEPLKLEPCLY